MNTFTIESWCKPVGAEKSLPMGEISFRVNDEYHLEMESVEERLAASEDEKQAEIPVDMNTLELRTPAECGELSDCQFHVFVNKREGRGHFFLKGHRANDHALIYSNAVMVDELG
ncbi:MAG: hypothetical protein V7731_15935 [Amphritea sp.]